MPEDARHRLSDIITANERKIESILGYFVVVSNQIFTFKKWDGYGEVNKFKFKKHPDHKLKLKLSKYFDFDNIFNSNFTKFEAVRVVNF